MPCDLLKSMDSNLNKEFDYFKALNLSIDVTRGKPHSDQLDLSQSLLDAPLKSWIVAGSDIRNYGDPLGIMEARKLGAEILDGKVETTLAGEQSSLLLIYQIITALYLHGMDTPWRSLDKPKIICPVPGFDRHFRIFEDFGIEMLNLPLEGDGPDIDAYKELLNNHSNIVGIIAVPKHSNPSGDIYSIEKIQNIFEFGLAYSADFCFLFDHAYIVHDLEENMPTHPILNIAKESGALETTAVMTSFSKITFGGAGLSFFSAGKRLFNLMVKQRAAMIICPDKINQQRHLQFLSNTNQIKEHMRLHAKIIKPKFSLIQEKLSSIPSEIGSFKIPKGGYFVSFNTKLPIATRVVEIANSLGVKFTPAGATFPYGKDPGNSNIRIAPSFLNIQDLSVAMDVFLLSLKLAHQEVN